ncbi:MAG: class I SAM-dependent methyltransferase [Gemmatimonadota bacterium]|jgi:methyltransferase-like protein/SAM-dependent methyltransferase
MTDVPPPIPVETPYDEVPYESSSFPQSHPDRLATLGTLFGLDPAPVDRCRVLELGCAAGANLLPMAFHLPGSEFVGVDASGRQVAEAHAVARRLELENVRIEHASILDVDAGWGEFDYLICHGVFAWVPEAVQEKILAIAAENLRPHGIAFISYNTYPGWHVREAVRHMMLYHADRFPDVPERIGQARALLEFLAENVDAESYYGAALESELKLVNRVRDSYLFHDHLEEVNMPLYFHEFVARASRQGLRYLAEADFATMLTSGFPASTAETLHRISPDLVHAEQYMDFLRNRFFRQTLLCDARLELERELDGSSLAGLLLASLVVPEDPSEEEDPPSEGLPAFKTPDGRRVTTSFPLTHAVLEVLAEQWPRALDQDTLRALACERLDGALDLPLEEAWEVVLGDMLHCYSQGAVELRTWQAPCENRVGERPRVSNLVAEQVRTTEVVTNQLHMPVRLDAASKCLVPMLDGTRDRAALLAGLVDCVARGELNVTEDGREVTDQEVLRAGLGEALNGALKSFARAGLLVG